MLEMLGAERLVYGRLGERAVHACASRATLAPPNVGRHDQRCMSNREHLHWFDADTARRASDMTRAWPYPLLDRAPRRRQAGAREHAGRVPRRGAPRLPRVRVRRQAQRRRRAVPAARRHAGAHHARARSWRASAPGASCRARRRRLAQPRLRGRADARACRRSPPTACATASRSTSRSSPRRATSTHTGAVVAREAARLWAGAAPPPLLSSFRARVAAGRARQPRPSCRARCCSTRCGTAGSRPRQRAGLRGRGHQPPADGRRACSPDCTAPACAPSSTPSTTRRAGATADRAGHRRHHHRRGRSVPARTQPRSVPELGRGPWGFALARRGASLSFQPVSVLRGSEFVAHGLPPTVDFSWFRPLGEVRWAATERSLTTVVTADKMSR